MTDFTTTHRRGFTLFELSVSILVIAIVAIAAAPVMQDDRDLRVRAAGSILASDIEYAQAESIANPQDPIIIQFDVAAGQYFLARISNPTMPIPREDTAEPYLVRFGVGRARSTGSVTMQLVDMPDQNMLFDGLGLLDGFATDPYVTITAGGAVNSVVVTQTGNVVHISGEPESDDRDLGGGGGGSMF